MSCLFSALYSSCGRLVGYNLPLKDNIGNDITDYPVNVINVSGIVLGEAINPSAYVDIWNADIINRVYGRLFVSAYSTCFYLQSSNCFAPLQYVLGGAVDTLRQSLLIAMLPHLEGSVTPIYGVSKGGVVNTLGGTANTNIVTESTAVQDLRAKAEFIGKWCDSKPTYWNTHGHTDWFLDGMLTINEGNYFKCKTTGSYIEVDVMAPYQSGEGTISYRINGVEMLREWLFDRSITSGLYTYHIPITPGAELKFYCDGLQDTGDVANGYNKWTTQDVGLMITAIRSDGTVTPTTSLPKLLVVGDSIGEGISIIAINYSGQSNLNSGVRCWASTASRLLNYDIVIGAFSASGITVSGTGAVPKGIDNLVSHYQGKLLQNMPIFTDVIDAYGHNDMPRPENGYMSDTDFETEYTAYVNQIITSFGLKPICVIPLSGNRKAAKLTVAAAMGLKVIDMSLFTGVTYQDGVHPTEAGAITVANQFVTKYNLL